MDPKVKEDILAMLTDAIEVLKTKEEKDILELKELSDHTIHNASVFQDEDSITIAVILYAIYKIVERPSGLDTKVYDLIRFELKKAKDILIGDDVEGYRKKIDGLSSIISAIDSKLKLYVEEVINKAQIKKGSRLYEHGISLERAAEILDISHWELMSYVGKTRITDEAGESINVKDRIKFARGLFR